MKPHLRTKLSEQKQFNEQINYTFPSFIDVEKGPVQINQESVSDCASSSNNDKYAMFNKKVHRKDSHQCQTLCIDDTSDQDVQVLSSQHYIQSNTLLYVDVENYGNINNFKQKNHINKSKTTQDDINIINNFRGATQKQPKIYSDNILVKSSNNNNNKGAQKLKIINIQKQTKYQKKLKDQKQQKQATDGLRSNKQYENKKLSSIIQQQVQIIQVVCLQDCLKSHKYLPNQPQPTKGQRSKQNQFKQYKSYVEKQVTYQKIQKQNNVQKSLVFDKIPQLMADKFQLFAQYRRYVQKTLASKMKQEEREYPHISYSIYRKILTIWEKIDEETQNRSVRKQKFLRYGHLQRLAHGRWINDEIISSYISLMMRQIELKNIIVKQQAQQKQYQRFVILDSLKTASIFQKQQYIASQRAIQKTKINKTHSVLILVIYNSNHWFFLTCKCVYSKSHNKRINQITVYDSMALKNTKEYQEITIFSKIVDFMYKFYKLQIVIKICENYPQQNNNSDCGVIMLCGIKDILKQVLFWSFSATDMNYKRILITKQLIEGEITGL